MRGTSAHRAMLRVAEGGTLGQYASPPGADAPYGKLVINLRKSVLEYQIHGRERIEKVAEKEKMSWQSS